MTFKQWLNIFEAFNEDGKKFTKIQRARLGAALESAKKNGGKFSQKDILAMAQMFGGQEHMPGLLAYVLGDDRDLGKVIESVRNSHGRASEMANVKMDTLAGDLATLSSAWESFQLELMEGKGAEGFRNFTQGLTQDIRALKKSLEDGFDIGDIGGVVARIATQLKNKFLEFDGVGSILAGGALIMGMKKIYDWALKLKDAAIMVKTWWTGTAKTPSTTGRTGGFAQSVGSMVVHAGSVVVNGKVSSGAAPVTTTSSRPTTAPTPTGVASRFGSAAKVRVGAGILTGIFSIFDTYSTSSINQGRLSEAQAEYDAAKTEFTNAQEQYQEIVADPERAGELEEASAMSRQAAEKMRETSEALKSIQKEAAKHNNESLFGGAGAVAGATTGAAVGSVIPGAGTLVGGIVGAVLAIVGGYLGSEIGKDVGGNFEFDVLDRILGRDKKQPDWQTDEGKMFSELSYTEKADKLANMSAGEVERMTNSVQEQAKAEETVQMPTAAAVARHRVGAPGTVEQQLENLENKIASGATLTPAEMDQLNRQRGLAASAQAGMENTQRVQGFFQSVSDFFKIGMERYGKQAEFAKPENIFDGLKNNDGLAKVAECYILKRQNKISRPTTKANRNSLTLNLCPKRDSWTRSKRNSILTVYFQI